MAHVSGVSDVQGLKSIGGVVMGQDGAFEVWLKATGPGGLIGDAFFRIPVDSDDYRMWLDHLSPIRPGESKLVPPFPG